MRPEMSVKNVMEDKKRCFCGNWFFFTFGISRFGKKEKKRGGSVVGVVFSFVILLCSNIARCFFRWWWNIQRVFLFVLRSIGLRKYTGTTSSAHHNRVKKKEKQKEKHKRKNHTNNRTSTFLFLLPKKKSISTKTSFLIFHKNFYTISGRIASYISSSLY